MLLTTVLRMISRGTWLFGFLCLLCSLWAKAMRPLFRQLVKRAPATKTLARRFSGMLFSAQSSEKPEEEKDLLVRMRHRIFSLMTLF